MQASLLPYQVANSEAERVFNVVGDIKSKKRARSGHAVTKSRMLLTFDAREEQRNRQVADGSWRRRIAPLSDMIAVAEWRLAGASRSDAIAKARAKLQAPWPAMPERDLKPAPAVVESDDSLKNAMAEMDASGEFMNDAIRSRIAAVSDDSGFELADDVEEVSKRSTTA
jgi:hypothetical protein